MSKREKYKNKFTVRNGRLIPRRNCGLSLSQRNIQSSLVGFPSTSLATGPKCCCPFASSDSSCHLRRQNLFCSKTLEQSSSCCKDG
ncbi:hypothetical protein CHARACLAT_030263 [Characodon lateralis]|uniref:Uncharacterized protein n=1 Tax=Characodon lateralis TaxID=208331 RepID=A0ABU7D1W2_9TELE|nr:hypothetical protein [Characodon lateralis]